MRVEVMLENVGKRDDGAKVQTTREYSPYTPKG
jgi:hypothetical protein